MCSQSGASLLLNYYWCSVLPYIYPDLKDFLGPRMRLLYKYICTMLYLLIPLLGVALILFHFFGNPPTGKIDLEASRNGTLVNKEGNEVEPDKASASWWLLFTARQIVTFSLAKATQVFLIDFLCLGTRWSLTLVGHMITLLVVQSRGWPFLAIYWGLWNCALNTGSYPLAAHWLYWQVCRCRLHVLTPCCALCTSRMGVDTPFRVSLRLVTFFGSPFYRIHRLVILWISPKGGSHNSSTSLVRMVHG